VSPFASNQPFNPLIYEEINDMHAVPEPYNPSTTIDIMAAADDREVPKLLYSRRDAAFALSISVRNLDYRIANKEIMTRKIGKKIMVSHAELSRFARGDRSFLT
jgi:hypothetical protein